MTQRPNFTRIVGEAAAMVGVSLTAFLAIIAFFEVPADFVEPTLQIPLILLLHVSVLWALWLSWNASRPGLAATAFVTGAIWNAATVFFKVSRGEIAGISMVILLVFLWATPAYRLTRTALRGSRHSTDGVPDVQHRMPRPLFYRHLAAGLSIVGLLLGFLFYWHFVRDPSQSSFNVGYNVDSLAFSRDGMTLLIATDSRLNAWDVSSPQSPVQIDNIARSNCTGRGDLSADMKWLLCISHGDAILVDWPYGEKPVKRFRPHTMLVDVLFGDNRQTILTAGCDVGGREKDCSEASVRLWEMEGLGMPIERARYSVPYGEKVERLRFRADGNVVLVKCESNTIFVKYPDLSDEIILKHEGFTLPECSTTSADSKVVVELGGRYVASFSAANGSQIFHFYQDKYRGLFLDAVPLLMSTEVGAVIQGSDKLYILDWRSGGERVLRGHDAPITALASSPALKNPLLATGDVEGTVRLWRAD